MKRRYSTFKKFMTPVVVITALCILAIVAWQSMGTLQPLVILGYISASIGIGLGLYAMLPKHQRPLGRRLVLFLLGTSLFGVAALRDSAHMLFQIEGLFFDLLAGVFLAAVVHYLIAKIIGPLIFGRVWCGWACWTAMVLDLLPYKHSQGRIRGWGWVRYAHFALSLSLVLVLWFGFAYHPGNGKVVAVYWFVIGNALYYLIGVTLAFILKDNRAFCKYVCPITVPLKLTSRFALLKVKGDPEKCNERQECVQVCPMDIRITDYIKRGERVLSTECILCQACIDVCPDEALTLSIGFDRGGKEQLRERTHTKVQH